MNTLLYNYFANSIVSIFLSASADMFPLGARVHKKSHTLHSCNAWDVSTRFHPACLSQSTQYHYKTDRSLIITESPDWIGVTPR